MVILMKKIYKIMFFFSLVLTLIAAGAIVFWGLNFGVDFRGGSVLEVTFSGQRPSPERLAEELKKINEVKNPSASPISERGMIIRLNDVDEAVHQKILTSLNANFGKVTENRFSSIGPTVGQELKRKSLTAAIILLLAITVYVAFVFRKLGKVLSSWAMSLSVIAALLHDVIIPIGVFAFLGHFLSVEINAVFIAAILTILGYSVSDSVVVFDRVRENVLRFGQGEKFDILVHRSIMQTLGRSLGTTFTTLFSLIAIYIFGGESVKFFALALIIGIFLGAYSSIFVAAPILCWWHKKKA